MLTYARSGLSGVIGIRASGFFHSSQFQAPGGALEDLLSPRWRVPAPAHHVAARSFRWPGPGGRGSPHTFSHAAFDPEGSLPWGALPVPRLPPPQKPRLARVAPSWSHAASPPPAGRQPPQMPSHRIDPSPTSRGSGHTVLNRPDTLAPAGRSGPQPSPRRGRPAASPAWRPRGSPSSALRRSNVTWQAPTATPRANRDARPVLSAPRAASRLDPVRRPPPLPSTPAPTPAQFHLYSQAQGKVPRTRALSALTSRERTDSSPSARREPNRCLRAHCRRRRRLYRRRRCCTRVLVRRR